MPDEIQPSTTLFIDANIFLYKILDHRKYAEPCSNLLKEISRGRYSGVVSVLVCSEVFHRIMLAEVTERHNLDPRHAIRYLKDNPEEIKEFGAARSAIETIGQIENLKIVGLGENLMGLSLEFSRKYGLLSNDALHLAR